MGARRLRLDSPFLTLKKTVKVLQLLVALDITDIMYTTFPFIAADHVPKFCKNKSKTIFKNHLVLEEQNTIDFCLKFFS